MPLKFVIIGPGAVGSFIAGSLALSNQNVTLFGKEKHVKVIKRNKVQLKRRKNHIIKNIKITSNLDKLKDAEIIFLCVKSQDTKTTIKQIKNHINKESIIITLQNGIKNYKIIRDNIDNEIIRAICTFNVYSPRPGVSILNLPGQIIIEKTKNSLLPTKILNRSKIKTTLVNNIEPYQWSKLIINLQNPVSALTNQTVIESLLDDDTRIIMNEIMKEGLDIINKANIEISKIPKIDPEKMIKRIDLYNPYILLLGSYLIGIKKEAKNSMVQSLNQNKRTEIDYINGEIVNLAKENNLEAPFNSKIVRLIKDLEFNSNITHSISSNELKNHLFY